MALTRPFFSPIPVFVLLSAPACADDKPAPDTSQQDTEGGATDTRGEGEESTDSGSSTTNLDTSSGDSDESSDATGTGNLDECVFPPLRCPADAPVLGAAGAFQIDSFEVQFEFNEACGIPLAPMLHVIVPDDIVSLGITVEEGATETGIGLLDNAGTLIDLRIEGPGGLFELPFRHSLGPAGSVAMPISTETAPAPGCLAVVPISLSEADTSDGFVHFVTRRGQGQGLLDVNIVVAEGTQISEDELAAALSVMNDLYVGADADAVALGVVERFDTALADGPFVSLDGPDLYELRASMTGADPASMNMFLVADLIGGEGTLGFASGIPGPNGVAGTASSGVVVAVESHRSAEGLLDVQLLGETLAHEVGHQLGLFHTTERDGAEHDLALDTAECSLDEHDLDDDGVLVAEECPDGLNMMFWTSGEQPQTEISPLQSNVIFLSPITK